MNRPELTTGFPPVAVQPVFIFNTVLVPETGVIDHQETRQREPGPVTKERKQRDTPAEVPGKTQRPGNSGAARI